MEGVIRNLKIRFTLWFNPTTEFHVFPLGLSMQVTEISIKGIFYFIQVEMQSILFLKHLKYFEQIP